MLTESGHAKIIDFGLAKLLRPRPPFESGADTPAWGDTDPGRILGTAAYMSPEQVRGAEVDARSDLFAFGALLYEMLSGEPAFRRETGVETLHAVLKEGAPRLVEPGLGAAGPVLQRVLDRCLAKAPGDRYSSAAELLAEIREARRRLEAADSAERPAPVEARAGRAAAPEAAPAILRVLIVDDEEPARSLLREYLGRAGGVEIVGECRNGFEAVKAVNDLAPDLLFLDIQMPKLNGFEVLELLGRDVAVVFATAFDEHAIRAFEVNAVDYILKPASPERVKAALDRARRRLAARVPMPVAELAAAARPTGQPASRIVVRQGPKVHVIAADQLDFAEAQDDYVSLRSEGKSYLKQQTLGDLESSLDPKRFVRIHRSYLLNLDRLSRIDTEGGEPKAVVLADGTRLPSAAPATAGSRGCSSSREAAVPGQQAIGHRPVEEVEADPRHPGRSRSRCCVTSARLRNSPSLSSTGRSVPRATGRRAVRTVATLGPRCSTGASSSCATPPGACSASSRSRRSRRGAGRRTACSPGIRKSPAGSDSAPRGGCRPRKRTPTRRVSAEGRVCRTSA